MAEPCQKIEANPDIAGIGVRVSIYVQAAFALINLAIAIADGKVTVRERKVLREVLRNFLLASSALLASAFVQAGLSRLSIYHMLIILHLSWINSITAVTFCSQDVLVYLLHSDHKDFIDDIGLFFAIIQVTLTSALGIWTWARLPVAFRQDTCQTSFSIFSQPLVTSNPRLRVASIVIYSLFAIPVGNVGLILTAILFVGALVTLLILIPLAFLPPFIYAFFIWPITCFAPSLKRHYKTYEAWIEGFDPFESRTWLTVCFASIVAVTVVLVIDIELMIYRNRDLLNPGEGDWTFGQTLALFLLIPAGWEILRYMYDCCMKWQGKEKGDQYLERAVQAGISQDVGVALTDTVLKRWNTT